MVLTFIDGKRPDPRFFQKVFSTMMELEEKNGDWNYTPSHHFWEMYKLLLTKKVVTFQEGSYICTQNTHTQNTNMHSIMSDIMNENNCESIWKERCARNINLEMKL